MPSSFTCWMNGAIVPPERACVSVLDHGLLYGDGVFEGIRFYHRRPFLLEAHLARLRDSARAIALSLPLSDAELARAVAETIAAHPGRDGYLRLVVTRGAGALGLDPDGCEPTVFIVAADLATGWKGARKGAKVVISSLRKAAPDTLDPRIKSLNYLPHILARIEARRAGADEALLLNARGHLAEGAADNLFIVKGGELRTPPVTDGALAGVTRALVLEFAAKLHIPARECPLAPWDLHTADECFLTGTGAEMIPVAEADGRALPACPGPVFTRLEAAFRRAIEEACHDHAA